MNLFGPAGQKQTFLDSKKLYVFHWQYQLRSNAAINPSFNEWKSPHFSQLSNSICEKSANCADDDIRNNQVSVAWLAKVCESKWLGGSNYHLKLTKNFLHYHFMQRRVIASAFLKQQDFSYPVELIDFFAQKKMILILVCNPSQVLLYISQMINYFTKEIK